jgi:hypothetical protein
LAVHQEGDTVVLRKSDKLTIRIDPGVKKALREVADGERRSVANMVEVLVRDHCRKAGVAIEGVSTRLQTASARKPKG